MAIETSQRTGAAISTPLVDASASSGAHRQAGLRERGKNAKQQRIKEAAKAVFSDVNNDDEATTREIARRAGVSIGTLFVYAKDKRDLLFLVFNDELYLVADAARRGLPEGRPTL